MRNNKVARKLINKIDRIFIWETRYIWGRERWFWKNDRGVEVYISQLSCGLLMSIENKSNGYKWSKVAKNFSDIREFVTIVGLLG